MVYYAGYNCRTKLGKILQKAGVDVELFRESFPILSLFYVYRFGEILKVQEIKSPGNEGQRFNDSTTQQFNIPIAIGTPNQRLNDSTNQQINKFSENPSLFPIPYSLCSHRHPLPWFALQWIAHASIEAQRLKI